MCSMKKMYLSKCAAAVALLFAVNMNADAQFGKLKNLAKKVVKETVEETVSGTSSSSSSSTSVTDVKNVVASAAAPGELPWPMSREGQSNIMQYIEKSAAIRYGANSARASYSVIAHSAMQMSPRL